MSEKPDISPGANELPQVQESNFQIRVIGSIDDSWSDWLGVLHITSESDTSGRQITVITGPVADQAELRGILNRIWDLNLSLISVYRIPQ